MVAVYTPAFKPFDHQRRALAAMEGQEAFALLMEMRTGKTKTLLDDYGRLELDGQVRNLLVLAPGGVYRTWEGACAEHLSLDLKNRALIHVWRSGAGIAAKRARQAFMDAQGRPRILLMNIEALSSVKEAREMALKFLKSGTAMLAIDESTIIKNASAKRTKFVNSQLSPLAPYRRILCGLPSPNSPLDLYSQFEFLDWKIIGQKSYYAFRNRYAIIQNVRFGGREVPLVKGYRNIEDLQARIAPYSFRVRLEDCYDLPPKAYMIRHVSLTEEQERLYKEMRQFATAKLSETQHVTATIVISQLLRMHQILCGHTTDETGQIHFIPENRTKELLSTLEEYTGKAIIWCSYDADIKKVSKALADEYVEGSVARFWGGNTATREEEERDFLLKDACRFMVATAAAGGRGRTWTNADLILYYSNTHNLEHRSQSEERAQGIGKRKSVAYIDLVAPGTIDEKIIDALRNKINLSSALLGDRYKEWLI